MAIHWVLIYYLISHSSTLAKSLASGKETPNLPSSVLFPDASNSSLLSVTYDSFPSLNLKSRIKVLISGKISNETTGEQQEKCRHFGISQRRATDAGTITPIVRPSFLALSPFVPNLNLHSLQRPLNKTRVSNYPRILLSNKNTATAAPPTVQPLTNVSLFEDFSTETVIPVNLSAHFKLANTHQQQRVVLNNIQEIINSLKSEQQRSEKNSTSETGQNDSRQAKPVIIITNANGKVNSTSNSMANYSVFKLKFFEKLRQHQNLLLRGRSKANSTKPVTRLDHNAGSGDNNVTDNGSSFGGNSSAVKVTPENVFKTESYTLPSRGLTPSVFNRTQWQALNNLVQPIDRRSIALHHKPLKHLSVLQNSGSFNQTSEIGDQVEKEEDESKFMTHLKDYLAKLDHPAPVAAKPAGRHLTIRPPMGSTKLDMSRIDYGEVERILAYVNPYGRRISMPSNEYSLAESQTHENRNMRFQRSANQFEWLNETAPSPAPAFVDSLWDQVGRLNQTAQSDAERDSWLNSLLAEFNQTQLDSAPSTTDPLEFINFPSANNYSREVAFNERELASNSNFQPNRLQNKAQYGMRNHYQNQPSKEPSRDLPFGWLDKPVAVKEAKQEAPLYTNQHFSELPPVDIPNFRQLAQTTINYNPKESEFTYYPRDQFVGGEQWRQENTTLFSESDRDWVAYFRDLEQKMKIDHQSQRNQELFSEAQKAPRPAFSYEEFLMPVTETIESFDGITGAPPMSSALPPSRIMSPQATQSKAMSVSISPKINRNYEKWSQSPLSIYGENTSPMMNFASRERIVSGGKKRQIQLLSSPLPSNIHPMFRVSSNVGRHYQAPLMKATNRVPHLPPPGAYGHRINSPSMPDLHFRPPSPYHLSRVIQYSNKPSFPPTQPYMYY